MGLYARYWIIPVYCQFKQANGITTAKEITEDNADHGIHRYYEECPRMLNRENEQLRLTDRRHRLTDP